MTTSYKIFPSIGIARVGNSSTAFYLAAESPQLNFLPDGGYREGQNIRRMGQRFRIFEYEDETPVREITGRDATIQWNVRLGNSKAAKPSLNPGIPRQSLTIDTGIQPVQGMQQDVPVQGVLSPQGQPIIVPLGNLRTDDLGRLIVLGGFGHSASWDGSQPFSIQNSGWYDDVSDGLVGARLQMNGSSEVVEAESAWVIIGVPDFAHPIFNIVTLYDLALDNAVQFRPMEDPTAPISFTQNIFPVLHRTVFMQWTNSRARFGHSTGPGNFLEEPLFTILRDNSASAAPAREAVFNRLRNPNNPSGSGNMPALAGGLTLTEYQLTNFEKWKNGIFNNDWDPAWNPYEPPQPPLESFPIEQQPDVLNQASLGGGVGGPFNPGIEADFKMGQPSTYESPFRISRIMSPGDLTQGLSVPWQADFKLCTQVWWPGARPGSVIVEEEGDFVPKDWVRGVNNNMDMVSLWSQLGFIIRQGTEIPPRYTEQDRVLNATNTLGVV